MLWAEARGEKVQCHTQWQEAPPVKQGRARVRAVTRAFWGKQGSPLNEGRNASENASIPPGAGTIPDESELDDLGVQTFDAEGAPADATAVTQVVKAAAGGSQEAKAELLVRSSSRWAVAGQHCRRN